MGEAEQSIEFGVKLLSEDEKDLEKEDNDPDLSENEISVVEES